MPNLIVLNGLRRGSVLPLEARVVIGREASVDLRLPDFLVSSRHAEVRSEGGAFVVSDLASTNGTYKNGVRVLGGAPLVLGDVLTLGSTEVLVSDEAAPPREVRSLVHAALALSDEGDDPVRFVSDAEDEDLALGEAALRGGEALTLALPVLRAVHRSFAQARDRDDLLERIAEQFALAVGGRGVVVAIPDGGRAAVRLRGHLSGGVLYRTEELDFAVRDDLLERALTEPGVLLARAGTDGSTSVLTRPEGDPERSDAALAVCVGVAATGGALAAIYVHDARTDLSRDDLRLLLLVAGVAGVHCRTHLLLEEVRDRNAKLKAANDELERARTKLARWNVELQAEVEARTAELGLADERMRLLSRIVENVSEAVVSTTLDGVVTSWNPGAEALYGYPAAEVVGEVLPTVPDARSAELERILEAVARGERLEVRTERVARDDRALPVHATFAPVTHADGTIAGLVEITRDLTEQLRTEERMRWRERMASFGELASGLAHELGNPLANLRSGVEHLLARERPPEEARASLTVLKAEIARLNRLAGQALDLARWRAPARERVDLEALLEYVSAAVRPRASELQIALRHAQGEPASGGAALLATGDADQLKQALLNLVHNAIDAMPKGGKLELAGFREGAQVGFSVSDTGIGIAPEDCERIFELFFSKRAEGSGIGLAIVKRIVDLHAGAVVVESAPGVGTTMRVLLPAWSEEGGA